MKFYPEGKCKLLQRQFETLEEAESAMKNGDVFEARVILCDSSHNLHLNLGAISGVIPKNEGAIGISDGSTKDIALISRVNKFVCCKIVKIADSVSGKTAILSRRAVQEACFEEYLDTLNCGDVIDAVVTHLERFGAFIDIGAGINALIPINMLSVSRINHPRERVFEGQKIKAVLKKRDGDKLTFSLKELLGTWEENASLFSPGDTVTGVVRSIEDYGVFVELAPNLAGLAETREDIFVGQQVAVFVKSILPQKMKIKLVIVETFDKETEPTPLTYWQKEKRLTDWHYSPKDSEKQMISVFQN